MCHRPQISERLAFDPAASWWHVHIESWDNPFAVCLLQDERQVRMDMEGPYMPAASLVRGFPAWVSITVNPPPCLHS